MSAPTAAFALRGSSWDRARAFGASFPRRLHERSFWIVQAGVAAIAVPHIVFEAYDELMRGYAGIASSVHHIPVALYVVPIAYAGYRYGLEGGLLTGLWCSILTLPNILVWHRADLAWLGEGVYLSVVVAMGVLLALPVERERRQRERAEATSQKLSLLNEFAGHLARGPCEEGTLSAPLERLAAVTGVSSVSLRRGDVATVGAGAGRELIPIVLEDKHLGALEVSARENGALDAEDRDMFVAVASQVGIALERARLNREEHARLRSYAHNVMRAQEEERKYIARELHDETAQGLIVICRQLDALGEVLPDAERRRLGEIRRRAWEMTQSVRRFSRNLRPVSLDLLGLVPAIEALTSELRARTGIDGRFSVSGDPRRLSPEAEVAFFRIAQEALRNVERHADAASARVEVGFEEGRVSLRVADDGCGFDPSTVAQMVLDGRAGLLGLRERARLLGGTLTIESIVGGGTTIITEAPTDRPGSTMSLESA